MHHLVTGFNPGIPRRHLFPDGYYTSSCTPLRSSNGNSCAVSSTSIGSNNPGNPRRPFTFGSNPSFLNPLRLSNGNGCAVGTTFIGFNTHPPNDTSRQNASPQRIVSAGCCPRRWSPQRASPGHTRRPLFTFGFNPSFFNPLRLSNGTG